VQVISHLGCYDLRICALSNNCSDELLEVIQHLSPMADSSPNHNRAKAKSHHQQRFQPHRHPPSPSCMCLVLDSSEIEMHNLARKEKVHLVGRPEHVRGAHERALSILRQLELIGKDPI
jgi:hypothetical protein